MARHVADDFLRRHPSELQLHLLLCGHMMCGHMLLCGHELVWVQKLGSYLQMLSQLLWSDETLVIWDKLLAEQATFVAGILASKQVM